MSKFWFWASGIALVVTIGWGFKSMVDDHNTKADMRTDILVAMEFTPDPDPKENAFTTLENPRLDEETKGLLTYDVVEMNVVVKGCSVELERRRGEKEARQVGEHLVEAYTIDEVLYNKREIDLEDYPSGTMVFSVADVEAYLASVVTKDSKLLPCYKP